MLTEYGLDAAASNQRRDLAVRSQPSEAATPAATRKRNSLASARSLAGRLRLWQARHSLEAIYASAAAMAGGWLFLFWRYSLFRVGKVPRFGFGEVKPESQLALDLAAFVLIWAGYLGGYHFLRRSRKWIGAMLGAIAGSVLLAVVLNALLYPMGALDFYHYLMTVDMAFRHHVNPYLVTYRQLPAPDVWAKYGFVFNLPLGYGPGWLLLSLLPAPLAGLTDVMRTVFVYKGYTLLLFAGTAVAIWWQQGKGRAGLLAAYLFVANPLVLFEGLANAHNDVMVALFLVLAVVALEKRSLLALPALVASALIKFTTAPLGLLFLAWMIYRRWPLKRVLASAALCLPVMAAAILPFWSGGRLIGGMMRGSTAYLRTFYSSSLLSLGREWAIVSGRADPNALIRYGVLILGALTILVVALSRRRTSPIPAALAILLLVTQLATNLFPWYLVTVVPLIAMYNEEQERWYLFMATLLGLVYYPISTWVWARLPKDPPAVHIYQALLLTVPILVYLEYRLGQFLLPHLRFTRRPRGMDRHYPPLPGA